MVAGRKQKKLQIPGIHKAGGPIRRTITQAVRLHQQGKLAGAEQLYRSILSRDAGHFDALHLLGVVCAQSGRTAEALELLNKAVEKNNKSAEAHNNRGNVLKALGLFDGALADYEQALTYKPEYIDACINKGDVLRTLNRFEEALACYEQLLKIRPDHFEAHFNKGMVLRVLKRLDEALACYEQALKIKPDSAEVYFNRGNILYALKRLPAALASYEQALKIRPAYAQAHNNRANILKDLKRFDAALAGYEAALKIRPDYDKAQDVQNNAFSQAAVCHRKICDWSGYEAMEKTMADRVRDDRSEVLPFVFLSWSEDPADQQRCAETFVKNMVGSIRPFTPEPVRDGGRIRIAYVSADYYRHATAYLMAELFELHDRKRFEILGISFGPADKSPIRKRVIQAFDEFIEVGRLSDREVAELLIKKDVHIAVDLKGFTTDCRPGIFAHRPAPIQVNYLGYPGTMGAEFIDYILVDPFIAPAEQEQFFTEKPAYLPDCYQVNDRKRRISRVTPGRTDCGLPAEGFVFCSFNNSYKITPFMFDIWMRLLSAVPGSVMWFLEDNQLMQSNLQKEAARRGVDPARLVFAPFRELPDHLARHRHADLFLDTLPYNAHTTASDALWAGLPVLTCPGKSFQARVAGSLLHAVGLPELVTNNLEEYESLALSLARDPERLRSLREKLLRQRDTMPLFDTERFCRNLESAYETMWQRWRTGEPPQSFSVKSLERPFSDSTQIYAMAFQLHQQGKVDEAERCYKEILEKQPRHFDALHMLGVLHLQQGSLEAAGKYLKAAISIEENPFVLCNYGSALAQLERLDEALACYDRALVLKPDYATAFNNRGNVLKSLKRLDDALISYDQALAQKPDYVNALNSRGNTLQELNRLEEALTNYDMALQLKPDYAEAYNNRGNVLKDLKRFDEALANYDRALQLKPDYADVYNNRGNVFKELKRFDEALASYDRALQIKPDFAEVHCNKGMLCLLMGNFKYGWKEYEWRRKMGNVPSLARNFPQPQWTGNEDLRGKTILLYAEQGLGDTIQFCRFVSEVKSRGARVILEVQQSLKLLLSGLAGVDCIFAYGEALPDFDYHCPLLSLPLVFNTVSETIPAVYPYLIAPPEKVTFWHHRIETLPGPNIGLVWSGNPKHRDDNNRSIPLEFLFEQLRNRNSFIALQTEVRTDDMKVIKRANQIHFFGDELKDFTDTAGIIGNLDLVISVDTSVVHLAGALGKPVWILLPFIPDWRWLMDRDDSPWYKSARLYRQPKRGDWNSVLDRIKQELKELSK